MVQAKVEQGMKQQRAINKEERDLYFAEQREAEIDDKVTKTNTAMRAFMSSIFELQQLAEKHPFLRVHPKIGGMSHRLDMLVNSIQQLSKTLK
jgi:hypothetical protein